MCRQVFRRAAHLFDFVRVRDMNWICKVLRQNCKRENAVYCSHRKVSCVITKGLQNADTHRRWNPLLGLLFKIRDTAKVDVKENIPIYLKGTLVITSLF